MKPILHQQVLKSDTDGIKTAILDGSDLNELDDQGHTPLHWAVMRGDIDTVKQLLEAGSNPNTLSSDGITPKWSAVDFGLFEIEQLLDSYGGKVKTGDGFDRTSWTVFKNAIGQSLPKEE